MLYRKSGFEISRYNSTSYTRFRSVSLSAGTQERNLSTFQLWKKKYLVTGSRRTKLHRNAKGSHCTISNWYIFKFWLNTDSLFSFNNIKHISQTWSNYNENVKSNIVLVYWQRYDLMTQFNLFISLNADLYLSEGSIPPNSLLRWSSFTPRQFPQPRECASAFLSYHAVRKTS